MQRLMLRSPALWGFIFLLSMRAASAQTASVTAAAPSAESEPPVVTKDFTPVFPEGIWELSHENDWFLYSDRDYTSGLRLAYTTPNYSNWDALAPMVPDVVGDFFDKASFISSDWATVAGAFYVQQNMYTPESVLNPPNPNDHPYGGWLGVGADLIRQTADRRAIFETNAGLVGPYSGAEDLQDSFHSLIGDNKFQGWNSQLKTEPVLQLTYRQDWRPSFLTNLNPYNLQPIGYDVIGHGVVTAGNGWDYAALGAMARVGYHLPLDFGPSRMRLGEVDTMPYEPGGTKSGRPAYSLDTLTAYYFIAAEGRAVAHDITLNGNTWASSPSVVNEPLVAEYYTGTAVTWGAFRGSFMVIYETDTFRDQSQFSSRGQWRGQLTLGCGF